jgi:NodT family efflux transporter outer membrane factor (OMF) lipoprotein
LFFLLSTGCSQEARRLDPPVSPPDAFSRSGSGPVPAKWWTVFANPALDRMVDAAIDGNFRLGAAWQRLRAARAAARRESAAFYPHLGGSGSAETGRSVNEDADALRLGLAAQYEVDLWGRIRARAEAEEFRARAALTDYQSAALSISAEIVTTWYRLAAAGSQLSLIEAQVETNEKVLSLIRARFGTGQTGRADILRQEELLEATRRERLAVEARIGVFRHQLAVLSGLPPLDADYQPAGLPRIPPLPDTGLPLTLVRRRPDVLSAYNSLLAADRDLAAAISSQYPRLTLSASLATSSRGAASLFEDWARSFSGSIMAPLFDAGQRRAEASRARAEKEERLYEYGLSILTAFKEVEDALLRERKQEEQMESLSRQVRLARAAYRQLRTEYVNGVSDFIDVLFALTDVQGLERELIRAELARLEYRIGLYRALAGGFDAARKGDGNEKGGENH